jgi:hypothetical protein
MVAAKTHLPIANFRLPIADLCFRFTIYNSAIGNRTIGNQKGLSIDSLCFVKNFGPSGVM